MPESPVSSHPVVRLVRKICCQFAPLMVDLEEGLSDNF
jgi:hypothetical protein